MAGYRQVCVAGGVPARFVWSRLVPDYSVLRTNMVEGQLRPSRITSPWLLRAMSTIPREQFVPQEYRDLAYADTRIPLGGNRWLLEPLTIARMIQTAGIEEHEVVLDLGCASGYVSAILSQVASTVVGVESDPELAEWASESLVRCQVDNAVVIQSRFPLEDKARLLYDVIVIGGAVAEVPAEIDELLAEHGRLVAIVRARPGSPGIARLFVRQGKTVSSRSLFESAAPFLPGLESEGGFVFGSGQFWDHGDGGCRARQGTRSRG